MAEWIFPSNTRNYRVDDALRELGTIEWVQDKSKNNVRAGDIVYIYISSPISAIRWKCVVNKSHKNPGVIDDGKYSVPPGECEPETDADFIELSAVQELNVGALLDYDRLKANGLRSRLQGSMILKNGELANYIHKVIDASANDDQIVQDAERLEISALLKLAKKHTAGKAKISAMNIKVYRRNPYIAEYAKRRANGICQLCGKPAPFMDTAGRPYLESHHIIWLSAGGADSIGNTVALCPNCHKKMHVLADKTDVLILQKANGKIK